MLIPPAAPKGDTIALLGAAGRYIPYGNNIPCCTQACYLCTFGYAQKELFRRLFTAVQHARPAFSGMHRAHA